MQVKEVIKELYKCNKLKCQGCHLNIKVLHSFDCAARIFPLEVWKDRLVNALKKGAKDEAFLEAIDIHEKNKDDCKKCPLYEPKFGNCELKLFRDRQDILRAMRDAGESDADEQQITGNFDSTRNSTEVN